MTAFTAKKYTHIDNSDRYARLELIIYGLIWLLVAASPFAIRVYDRIIYPDEGFRWDRILWFYNHIALFFVVFLVNNFLMLPLLLRKGRSRWLYFVLLFALLVAAWYVPAYFVLRGIERCSGHPIEPTTGVRLSIYLFRMVCVVGVGAVCFSNMAIKFFIRSISQQHTLLELNNARGQAELDSLRYQINPHVLMNTLNNIQALVVEDPDRACQTIQQLSKVMRYILYDISGQEVTLGKVILGLSNFIELMRIRYGSNLTIITQFPEGHDDELLPPMLFISFIENAFKHGVNSVDPSLLEVKIGVTDSMIQFRCRNTIHNYNNAIVPSYSGLGLDNVHNRLDLMYGDTYSLTINNDGQYFDVALDIPRKGVTK